jgi:hypothetical protein
MNCISPHRDKLDHDCENHKEIATKLDASLSPSIIHSGTELDRNYTEQRECAETPRNKDETINEESSMHEKDSMSNLIDGFERRLGNIFQTMFLKTDEIDYKTLIKDVDLNEFNQLSMDEQTLALEEAKKIQQMNSWDTYECNSPPISPSSLASDLKDNQVIEGATYQNLPKDHHRRRRKTVKFDHPLVTSMKQCPRLSKSEIKELFFSVEELKQTEKEFDEYEEQLRNSIGIEIILSSSIDSETESSRDEIFLSKDDDESSQSCNSSIDGSLGDNAFAQNENMIRNEVLMTCRDIDVPAIELVQHPNENQIVPSSVPTNVNNDDENNSTEQEFCIPVN